MALYIMKFICIQKEKNKLKKIGYIFGILGSFGTFIMILYGITIYNAHLFYGLISLLWLTAIITNLCFLICLIDIDRLLKKKEK